MINYLQGNLFDSDADILVNTVNTKGVMGGGIALAFRERFPEYYNVYRAFCQREEVRVGRMFTYATCNPSPLYIVSFPTKDHYRDPSKLEYIDDGLNDLESLVLTALRYQHLDVV